MRLYFFQTSMQERGNGPQPTLRALPGQTFEDGTPVDENLNVQAPKEQGKSRNGNRFDYPDGTYFCSDKLREVETSSGVKFYSVYDLQMEESPNFHPVSDDPNFAYVEPQHRSDAMNLAFVKFLSMGDQEVEDFETAKPVKKSSTRTTPADASGKARPANPNWAQRYDDQLEQEMNLIVLWMRKLLNEIGVRTMARRPKADPAILSYVDTLYRSGENIDSICSRNRFMAVYTAQKMDMMGLQNIAKGPLQWYLEEITNEHIKGLDCTAVTRDPALEAEDALFIINTQMNTTFGMSNNTTPEMEVQMKDVLAMGWTLDAILEPEVLEKKNSTAELLDALKGGIIPLPENSGGVTLIEQLMANKKNACPKDKDGFHVDPLVWKLLVRNLHQHKNTLFTGPTGSGKTELVRMLCERTGTPFKLIPMGAITDPTEQLIGKMDLDPATNGTKFDWADFALAVQRPGVILLDEINRCPKNGYNILFSVLDGSATLTASGAKSTDQREIRINPDCVFFATANVGYEYTGTSEMDAALANRFINIELDYLEAKAETTVLQNRTSISKEDAQNIALVAANIRKAYRSNVLEHSISTRETIMCAELVRDGFEVEEALEIAFLPSFEKGATDKDPNSERGKVRAMIASRFNNA